MSTNYKVPYVNYAANFQTIKDEVIEAITLSLSRGDVTLRNDVTQFENSLAKYIGVKYAIGVNSGSDALLLALVALGLKKGGEVITSGYTCIATINAIVHAGLKPILVDVRDDFNIDENKAVEAFTKNTVAVLPVHMAGKCCKMPWLEQSANFLELDIIEDVAQAIGSTIHGKKAGSIGKIGCFSFHPMKTLGAYGDAGAVVTDNEVIAKRLKLLRRYDPCKEVRSLGYNSRLDNIQAAILNVKLKYLDSYIGKRREIARIYTKELSGIDNLVLQDGLDDRDRFNTFYSFTVRVKNDKRDELKANLESNGIETMVYWSPPIHKVLGLNFNLPNTEVLAEDSLALPIYSELTENQLTYTIGVIKGFLWNH